MRTNSCPPGIWIVLAALLAPVAGRAADDAPTPAQAEAAAHVERLVPVFRVAPEYPSRALSEGVNGFVEFRITVNPDGTVGELHVLRSDPPGVFDAAARKAMLRWKFKPKLVDGKAVAATGTQEITFEVSDRRKPAMGTACEQARKPARQAGYVPQHLINRLESAMKLAADSDFAGAEAALLELANGGRTAYGRAVVLQALGYVYARQQKDDQAIASYEQALATETLSWASHDQITFNLAKLYLVNGRQEQGMQLLDTHLKEACKPSADALALKQKLAPQTSPPSSP